MSISSNSSEPLPPLPLVISPDGYVLMLVRTGPRTVRLVSILRYPNNTNGNGELWKFLDLAPEQRRLVIAQIQRRYEGNSVHV